MFAGFDPQTSILPSDPIAASVCTRFQNPQARRFRISQSDRYVCTICNEPMPCVTCAVDHGRSCGYWALPSSMIAPTIPVSRAEMRAEPFSKLCDRGVPEPP